ncbi:MAG: hypothetical protein ACXWIU_11310 [Limisphaerales bacterium]
MMAAFCGRATWLFVKEERAATLIPHNRAGVDLISDRLPFGRPWYGEPNAISNAIDHAKFYSRLGD